MPEMAKSLVTVSAQHATKVALEVTVVYFQLGNLPTNLATMLLVFNYLFDLLQRDAVLSYVKCIFVSVFVSNISFVSAFSTVCVGLEFVSATTEGFRWFTFLAQRTDP